MDILTGKLPLQEQFAIIDECKRAATPLAEVLSARGLTYDALRYNEYPDVEPVNARTETLDLIAKHIADIPAISFFSGAGGLNIGFEYAGFNNLVSIEFNDVFCNTLRHNNPDKVVIGPPNHSGDVRQREDIVSKIGSAIGGVKPFEGVFHGGPPCQPFSVAANQRFTKDSERFKRQGFDDAEKGALIFDYLWYIRTFRPAMFLIENVAGIEDFDGSGMIKNALGEIAALGYNILPPKVINAAYYGVPQNRMRWLIIGSRMGKSFEFPKPNKYVTACYDVFARSLDGVSNHQTREHTAESVSRYMVLAYGCRDKLGRVDRLDPYMPSKTVIAGGTKGGGRSHLHPYSPRTISVRECARLQTFPDSYEFTGATARQFTQVGNAVPPLLAYKIAKQIRQSL
jgi:DNA (cytosine-5)-methyltransferase 1